MSNEKQKSIMQSLQILDVSGQNTQSMVRQNTVIEIEVYITIYFFRWPV